MSLCSGHFNLAVSSLISKAKTQHFTLCSREVKPTDRAKADLASKVVTLSSRLSQRQCWVAGAAAGSISYSEVRVNNAGERVLTCCRLTWRGTCLLCRTRTPCCTAGWSDWRMSWLPRRKRREMGFKAVCTSFHGSAFHSSADLSSRGLTITRGTIQWNSNIVQAHFYKPGNISRVTPLDFNTHLPQVLITGRLNV